MHARMCSHTHIFGIYPTLTKIQWAITNQPGTLIVESVLLGYTTA